MSAYGALAAWYDALTRDVDYAAFADFYEECFQQGRGACRIHGGGFAGTILAFVPFDLLDEYSARMNAVFGERATTALAIRPEGVVCIR